MADFFERWVHQHARECWPSSPITHVHRYAHNPPPPPKVIGTHLVPHLICRCGTDPAYWTKLSEASIQRIFSRYTWQIYAERLVTLSQIYTFW
jgi:sucrose synthase